VQEFRDFQVLLLLMVMELPEDYLAMAARASPIQAVAAAMVAPVDMVVMVVTAVQAASAAAPPGALEVLGEMVVMAAAVLVGEEFPAMVAPAEQVDMVVMVEVAAATQVQLAAPVVLVVLVDVVVKELNLVLEVLGVLVEVVVSLLLQDQQQVEQVVLVEVVEGLLPVEVPVEQEHLLLNGQQKFLIR
jgi:hypothetical protein